MGLGGGPRCLPGAGASFPGRRRTIGPLPPSEGAAGAERRQRERSAALAAPRISATRLPAPTVAFRLFAGTVRVPGGSSVEGRGRETLPAGRGARGLGGRRAERNPAAPRRTPGVVPAAVAVGTRPGRLGSRGPLGTRSGRTARSSQPPPAPAPGLGLGCLGGGPSASAPPSPPAAAGGASGHAWGQPEPRGERDSWGRRDVLTVRGVSRRGAIRAVMGAHRTAPHRTAPGLREGTRPGAPRCETGARNGAGTGSCGGSPGAREGPPAPGFVSHLRAAN